LMPNCRLDSLDETVDTLIIAGGDGWAAATHNAAFVDQLSKAYQIAGRSGAISVDAPRALSKQSHGIQSPALFNPNFEGPVISGGSSAGISLALAMIGADHGVDVAMKVAHRLKGWSAPPGIGSAETALPEDRQISPVIEHVRLWAMDHLSADLSTRILSDEAGMSVRNFSRAFKRATGETPAEFVARARIEHVRMLLEQTSLPIKRLVARCGFKSADSLRRVFVRQTGVTPAVYRKRNNTKQNR
jgi:transcriptional regulator GlxA family with amidase domain